MLAPAKFEPVFDIGLAREAIIVRRRRIWIDDLEWCEVVKVAIVMKYTLHDRGLLNDGQLVDIVLLKGVHYLNERCNTKDHSDHYLIFL